MYQRSSIVWTAIAVMGSAAITLMPQDVRLVHNGTQGDEVVRLVFSLAMTHWGCLVASGSWLIWRWRRYYRCGWRIKRRKERRYEDLAALPLRRSAWRYAAALGINLVTVGTNQLAVTALSRQGRPLSIVTLISKTAPFLLTLSDVRRSKWFPVIGAVQFAGAAIAVEFILIGGSFGVTINPSMVGAFPIIAMLIFGSLASVALRHLDRRIFHEEQQFLAQQMEAGTTTQEDASFLTARLMTVIQLGLTLFYGVCYAIAGALRGFPSWHGWELPAGLALFVLCGFASSVLVASSIHGRLALYGAASASMLGFAYLWNWLFQGLPFTGGQLLGSLVVVLVFVAALLVERRAMRAEASIEDELDMDPTD